MIAAADRRRLLVDHSKFGRPAPRCLTGRATFDAVLTGRAAAHGPTLAVAAVRLAFFGQPAQRS